jgi:hypothetical protein
LKGLIVCKKCGRLKRTSFYYISSKGILLKGGKCKECISAYNKMRVVQRRRERDALQEAQYKVKDKNIWKTVPGYPNCYISIKGEILSYTARRGFRLLSLGKHTGHNGYITCTLRSHGKGHLQYVHRLIALCYVPGRSTKRNCVNHKDGSKENNDPSNLEWVSPAENNQHMYSVLGYHGSLYGVYGDAHPGSRKRRLQRTLQQKKGE